VRREKLGQVDVVADEAKQIAVGQGRQWRAPEQC
jgi:hypothetical protein